jgi:hypothetical protein
MASERRPEVPIEAVIQVEMNQFRQGFVAKNGTENGWKLAYFNNFTANLPAFESENVSNYRILTQKACPELLHVPFEQAVSSDIYMSSSEVRKRQTFAQFFSTIDLCIADTGLDMEKIKQLQVDRKTREELINYVFPVYLKLREMGYNRYPDLTF